MLTFHTLISVVFLIGAVITKDTSLLIAFAISLIPLDLMFFYRQIMNGGIEIKDIDGDENVKANK